VSSRSARWCCAGCNAFAGALLPQTVQAAPAALATAHEYAICANSGAGLCLQDNSQPGSLIANDTGNGRAQNQLWGFTLEGATSHSSSTSIGFPFDNATLNNQVAAGRKIWGMQSDPAVICVDVNDGIMRLNNGDGFCVGSQAALVMSGSGWMTSVGASNSGNPQMTPNNACPTACWGNVDSIIGNQA
jgi:hypothetical protein